ncbi:MAG TPA: hypothetical protein VL527_16025 [Dongiaceae bacterium]|nr:hypothetical protein [Dongiaceae bacterium]
MNPFRCIDFASFVFIVTLAGGCLGFVTGCAHPQSGMESELARRIEMLKYESVDMELGMPRVGSVEDCDYVIQHNPEAIPLLVAVLRNSSNLHQVGFAAHCLRAMKTDAGKKSAAALFAKLDKKKLSNFDEVFAHLELGLYLDELADGHNLSEDGAPRHPD